MKNGCSCLPVASLLSLTSLLLALNLVPPAQAQEANLPLNGPLQLGGIAAVSLMPDLPVISIAAAIPEVKEPMFGGPAEFGESVVKRSGDIGRALTIHLVFEGSATPGADYEALPSVIDMPANVSEVSLRVEPVNDAVYEGTESVVATLVARPVGQAPQYNVDSEHSTAKILIYDNGS